MTSSRPHIDLNADLGEGFPRDEALLAIVSSANVCCGAYAGSPSLTTDTIAMAAARGVRVGAHVGYPDRANFGRAPYTMTELGLRDSVRRQLDDCARGAHACGTAVTYLKPHGALYHAAVAGPSVAVLLAELAAAYGLAVLHQAGTALATAAAARNVKCVGEGFADRRYLSSGLLAPRSEPGAMLTDHAEVDAQAIALASGLGQWTRVDSLCVHGDDEGAVRTALRVREALRGAGFIIGSVGSSI